MTSVSKPITKP